MTRSDVAKILRNCARSLHPGKRPSLSSRLDFAVAANAVFNALINHECPTCGAMRPMSYGNGRICLVCGTRWELGRILWVPEHEHNRMA